MTTSASTPSLAGSAGQAEHATNATSPSDAALKTTPVRPGEYPTSAQTAAAARPPVTSRTQQTHTSRTNESSTVPAITNTVTPLDSKEEASVDGEKQVRFGVKEKIVKDEETARRQTHSPKGAGAASTTEARSPLHSTDGGESSRHGGSGSNDQSSYKSGGSPKASSSTSGTTVLEFKTYRSPSRNKQQQEQRTTGADEEVPSLCSSNSHHDSVSQRRLPAASQSSSNEGVAAAAAGAGSHRPTTSISVDPSGSNAVVPSPLTSHHHPSEKPAAKTSSATAATSPVCSSGEGESKDYSRSPRRNPNLPSLDDSKLQSPGGMFLSPNPPTPSGGALRNATSFEEKKHDVEIEARSNPLQQQEDGKPSPRRDREHYVATPTDFALDYGKNQQVSGSFDTSNVLAWLQSPTANGLFSPGGLGSIMNTPGTGTGTAGTSSNTGAANLPRTPRTPTVSTSFFFSDVAGLPRNENMSPKAGGDGSDSRSKKKGSNIICISPLASSRHRNGLTTSTGNTPMNFKDVFASPKGRGNLPLLSDTPSSKSDRPRVPQRSSSKDPSLDAVHLAERDLMEDEDLSVLLQLASNNTPRSSDRAAGNGPAGGSNGVFRSPNRRKDGDGSGGLGGLQLPMIGNGHQRDNTKAATPRLSQKSRSRELTETEEFAPHLGMRSLTSQKAPKDKPGSKGTKDTKSGPDEKSKRPEPTKKNSKKGPLANPYAMPPPYPPPHGDMPPFYPSIPGLPPGIPPGPAGSMRVVVGGPPPPHRGPGSKNGSPNRPGASPHQPPPPYHDYPPPPPPGGVPYPPPPPPPPGMYSSYPPPYTGMGRYPPYSHYPPPPPPRSHMPMYSAQHPPGGMKDPKKGKVKTGPKGGTKRASPLLDTKPGSNKKGKRSPGSQPKKKNKSPQITDAGERQKAAATIQAVNAASGGKNDKAAALAAAILRGVTMRPSGKWQAQLYFAGKSRYIGVFDTREKAALAYEIAREKLKSGPSDGTMNSKTTENLVNAARKAAFEGVNERVPK